MFDEFGINAGYVEELHSLWLQAPQSVAPNWREFFEDNAAGTARKPPATPPSNGIAVAGAHAANSNGIAAPALAIAAPKRNGAASHARAETVLETAGVEGRVFQLINAYRVRGHLFAHLDPLGQPPAAASELELENFGLSESD